MSSPEDHLISTAAKTIQEYERERKELVAELELRQALLNRLTDIAVEQYYRLATPDPATTPADAADRSDFPQSPRAGR